MRRQSLRSFASTTPPRCGVASATTATTSSARRDSPARPRSWSSSPRSACASKRCQFHSTGAAGWARARCRSSRRWSPTGACCSVCARSERRSHRERTSQRRHRRRWHPRHDRRLPPRAGGSPRFAVRAVTRPRRSRRLVRLRRPPRRPLLPRRPADRRPRSRPRRGARARRPLPLPKPRDRMRLGAFVARCQLTKEYDELDDTPLLEWLRRRSGKNALERMWAPLLDSKFDGRFDDLPATYIWARTKRMSKTRDKSGAEVMGWLEGGYQTLIDALERKIRELGGEIHAGASVEQITAANGTASGLVVDGRVRPCDFVLCTLAPPMARRLLAPELLPQAPTDHCRYLGEIG